MADNNNTKTNEGAALDGNNLTMLPLEQVFSAIPYENRYEQLPEAAEEHRRFLESIDAKILTRFPPEPNGYLHLGHAKSMFINFGYAKMRGGKTYMRMDDTNPEKEEPEYIETIKETMLWLGHRPFKYTNTSDYFQRLYDVAVDMTAKGLMYVDNQTQEEIADYRMRRVDPPCRNRPIEENVRLFREMYMGLHDENSLTLRMKIDMQNDNPNMRDPIAYRIRYKAHPMTGDAWCIYPSYDFSHCLIDAFENITHSICTLEFNIRRPSYDWLTHIVGGYRPMQWEFSRLNITNNVMSKRRLLRLVGEKVVDGWSDPRLLTLVALRRRGFTPSIINDFCRLCGVSRGEQVINIDLLDYVARQEFDRTADRAMGLLDPLKVTLVDFDASNPLEKTEIDYSLHPKDTTRGNVPIHFGPVLYIDRNDFMFVDETNPESVKAGKKFFRLSNKQSVGLRYGPAITVKDIVRDESGKVIELKCTHCWSDEQKAELTLYCGKKRLTYIQWIAQEDAAEAEIRLYESKLFHHENPTALDDWMADVNRDSLIICKGMVPKFVAKYATPKTYKVFQFERIGYFVEDEVYSSVEHPVYNRVVNLQGNKI